jgi:hypothetical protein
MCPHGNKYQMSCSDCARIWYLNYKITKRALYLFRAAKARAKKFAVEFTISESDIVIPENCPVLGIPLDWRNREYAASVDRIDISQGYVPGNVCVISGRANRLKSNATVNEIEAILNYMKKEKR